ncbi:pilus assembly protein PilM [Elusimicrobiota bacterium]
MKAKKQFFIPAVYIDTKGIHVTLLAAGKKGSFEVSSREWIPFEANTPKPQAPQPGMGLGMATPQVQALRMPEFKRKISEVFKKMPAKGKEVMVCFADAYSVLRFFSMPKVERAYWRKAVPIEARKYIPFPLETCIYDWKPIEIKVGDKNLLGVLFTALKKDAFGAVEELFKSFGWKVSIADSLPFAISQGFHLAAASGEKKIDIEKETSLAVYLDKDQAQIILLHNATPILSRSIFLNEASMSGDASTERRKLDLQATLDFTKRQIGVDKITRILLIGSSALTEDTFRNWASSLNEDIGIEVSALKLPAFTAGAKAGAGAVDIASWKEFASLSLALRGAIPQTGVPEVNLIATVTQAPPKQVALKKVWTAVIVASVAFLGYGFMRAQIASGLQAQLTGIRKRSEKGVKELKGKNAKAVKKLLEEKSAIADVFRTISRGAGNNFTANKLEALAEHIPKTAWIENMTFDKGLKISPKGRSIEMQDHPRFMLRGVIMISPAQTELREVQEFFEKIKEHPALGQNYKTHNIAPRKSREEALDFSIDFEGAVKNRAPAEKKGKKKA